MPTSFKTAGLYKRPPDAMSYIRGGEVRGTVAFYEGWCGVRIVCRITGLKEGETFIRIGENNKFPFWVTENGVIKTALFKGNVSLDKIKGLRPFLYNNDHAVDCGMIK